MITQTIVVLVLITIPLSSSRGTTSVLITRICREADDFKFCRTVFKSYLEGPRTNIIGLNKIAITQALRYVSVANTVLSNYKAGAKGEMFQIYETCEFWYGLLLNELSGAKSSFDGGDYKTMVSHEEKCDGFWVNCNSAFGDKADLNLQDMQKEIKVLVQMVTVGGRQLADAYP